MSIKSYIRPETLTRVRVTAQGRSAFAAYLEAIGKLLGEGRGCLRPWRHQHESALFY